MKIAIIGAGEIGKAINKIIENKAYEVFMWDKDESKNFPKGLSFHDAVYNADFIFLCVPSKFLRNVLLDISKVDIEKTILIGVSKGMEEKTNMTNIEIYEDIFPNNNNFVVLSGPMLAEEIMENKFSGALLASKKQYALDQVSEIFKNTTLITRTSDDPYSVAVLGVLKNIYAILSGISDGFDSGNNTKSLLITLAIAEMKKILEILFENGEDAISLAGLGDFLTTSSGLFSKNYSFGFEMAKYGKSEIMSEGRISIPFFYEKLKPYVSNLSLFSAVYKIVLGENVEKEFKNIFNKL